MQMRIDTISESDNHYFAIFLSDDGDDWIEYKRYLFLIDVVRCRSITDSYLVIDLNWLARQGYILVV